MSLRPDNAVAPADIDRGKRALVQDAAWASVTGSLYAFGRLLERRLVSRKSPEQRERRTGTGG